MDDHEPDAAIPPPPPLPPPLPAAVPLEPPAPVTRRGRGRVWLALVVVAALIGLTVVAIDTGGDRDPDQALTSAQAFVAEATSFRFTVDITVEGFIDPMVAYDDEEDGEGPLERARATVTGEGEFATPNWHSRGRSDFDSDPYWYEAMLVDGVLYDRSEASEEELAESDFYADEDYIDDRDRDDVLEELSSLRTDETFSEVPGLVEELEVLVASFMYLTGFGDQVVANLEVDPKGYLDAVAALAEPETASQAGDTLTLKATMEPAADVVDAMGGALPPADIELDLDGNDRPSALRLTVSKGEVTFHAEIGFSDWGADLRIEAPPADQLNGSDDFAGDDGPEFEETGDALDPEGLEDLEGGGIDVEAPDLADPRGDQSMDGGHQSAVTGEEVLRLQLPAGVELQRPTKLPEGLPLVEVSVEGSDCGVVSLWYEGNAGYLLVGLRPPGCSGGATVEVESNEPAIEDSALGSLTPVTLEQLARELDGLE